jgi:hypothetical protein
MPTTTAVEALAARLDDIVRMFATRIAPPVDPVALDALRADILDLARAHAARTVLETVTARHAARHTPNRRRPWGCRPQVRRP